MERLTPVQAAALLKEQDNILILTHCRPDGDTVGSAAGLCAALRQRGKTACLLPNEDTTPSTAPYAEPYEAPTDFQPEFVVSVDISARNRLLPAANAYFDRIGLAIDHHPSFEGFGAAQCVDPSRAACGEIVYEICVALGAITPEIALPLYAAVATDTGCFTYANTTANTHRVAAALMDTGIDFFSVNKRHFRTKSRRRIALEAEVLSHLEFFHEGQGMFLICPLALKERLGASASDTEDLSMLAGTVEGVDCSVILKEPSPSVWRVSLRTDVNGRVNATEACRILGGGGHAMAAGATLEGYSLEQVKEKVLAAIERVKKF